MAKKWYIVHTHTGFERKVKSSLEERIKAAHQEELFGDILIPTEQVVEMVKGSRKTSERKFFPGYILVNMEMTQYSWHTVQETMRVTGFVGVNMSSAGNDSEIYKKSVTTVALFLAFKSMGYAQYCAKFGVIGQKELVTSPNNSEIQMTCEALPIPQNFPM